MSEPEFYEERHASPEQVGEWWRCFRQEGCIRSREQLVLHFLPLARRWAAQCFSLRVDAGRDFEDYLQHARVGLMQAVDRYDPARSVPFEAFASARIRGAILNALPKESERAAQREMWLRHREDRFESLTGANRDSLRDATLEEFVELALGLALGALLDNAPEEDTAATTPDTPYAELSRGETRRMVHDMLSELPERERLILQRHYFEHEEFRALAQQMGVTKGRISQIHAQALRRLRARLGAARLDRKL
jgi:RNA polymerase sigma factor for flagellar operon FliA